MPVSLTYPGLYIEELPNSARTITPAPTSITTFVGYTHPFQGECARYKYWGKPIQVFSFADYERVFGGLYRSTILPSHVADAVYQFFLNGGANAYVVGLQPRFLDVTQTPSIIDMKAAAKSVAGIRFTSKQLTEPDKKVSVSIGNVRPPKGAVTTDVADIMITYGSRVEQYRNVQIKRGDPASITDRDFIGKRLASSTLVDIAPDNGVEYPDTYGAASTTAVLPLDLGQMPVPTAIAPGLVQDFIDVFREDGDLDKVDVFNLLVTPGVANMAIWSAGLAFCERKQAFYIMDPPRYATADGMGLDLPTMQELIDDVPHASPNGALYFPYLNAVDPLSGAIIDQPPSGYVAGVYARTDTQRGVWKAPAGLETALLNTTGPVEEGRMSDMRQGTLNPLGVNVLRAFPSIGTVVWGARTITTDNPAFLQWRYVPVRRMALFIEQTLLRNLGWVVFEPNDLPLWTAIRLSIEEFMVSLLRQGAFQGSTPSEAFRVQCDSTTTQPSDIANGIVNIVVGFRPLRPAEFVVIKIAQLTGQAQ
jgi:uncharacterized protein